MRAVGLRKRDREERQADREKQEQTEAEKGAYDRGFKGPEAPAAQPEARTIEISTSAPAAIAAESVEEAPEAQPEDGTSESA